jgi:hypothetical protein
MLLINLSFIFSFNSSFLKVEFLNKLQILDLKEFLMIIFIFFDRISHRINI